MEKYYLRSSSVIWPKLFLIRENFIEITRTIPWSLPLMSTQNPLRLLTKSPLWFQSQAHQLDDEYFGSVQSWVFPQEKKMFRSELVSGDKKSSEFAWPCRGIVWYYNSRPIVYAELETDATSRVNRPYKQSKQIYQMSCQASKLPQSVYCQPPILHCTIDKEVTCEFCTYKLT